MTDGAARVVQGPLPVPPRRLPAPRHRRHPRRQVGDRLRADRRGQDARRRVRHPRRARTAAAASPTPRRSRRSPTRSTPTSAASSARTRSASSPATSRSTARAPVVVMTTEILRNMFYTGGLDGPRHRRARRVPLHGRRGARHGLGGDHRQLPEGRGAGGAVRHRANVRRDRRLDQPRPPAHRGHHPSAPAGAAAGTSSPTSRARSTRCDAVRARQGAPARRGARRAATTTGGRWYTRRVVGPHGDARRAGERAAGCPRSTSSSAAPGCERAMETVLAEGKPLLDARASSGRWTRPIRDAGHRQPDHRRVAAQPDHLPGARHGRGAPPRGHPAQREAAHRAALRARALQGGLRHRDHVARHPHAGQERGAPVADQAHRPRLPQR